MCACDGGEDASSVDGGNEEDGDTACFSEGHIGDVWRGEVGFCWRACSFDEDKVVFLTQALIGVENGGKEIGSSLHPCRCVGRVDMRAIEDDMRCVSTLWFEEEGVHHIARFETTSAGLEGLSSTNFTAFTGNRGIGGHILWLEGGDMYAAACVSSAEGGDDKGLSRIGMRALEH